MALDDSNEPTAIDIFVKLQSIDATERESLLAKECGDNLALRAEVERLFTEQLNASTTIHAQDSEKTLSLSNASGATAGMMTETK